MTDQLKELIENKIAVLNVFINQSGINEAINSKQYKELYGIKQACNAIGIVMDYFINDSGLYEWYYNE